MSSFCYDVMMFSVYIDFMFNCLMMWTPTELCLGNRTDFGLVDFGCHECELNEQDQSSDWNNGFQSPYAGMVQKRSINWLTA